MGHQPAAVSRLVKRNVKLDLVEQCNAGVGNMSAHVEGLFLADCEPRDPRAAAENAANEPAMDALTALFDSEGSLSEKYQDM